MLYLQRAIQAKISCRAWSRAANRRWRANSRLRAANGDSEKLLHRAASTAYATGPALNSFVNRRLVVPGGLLCSIAFMVASLSRCSAEGGVVRVLQFRASRA